MNRTYKGKAYDCICAYMDTNGNKVARIFYSDETEKIEKSADLPTTVDKLFKSRSGMINAKKENIMRCV